MSERRKIEDEQEARRCLAALEAEGNDIRAFARAHGVDGRSLHAWRVNLARGGTNGRAPRRRRMRVAQSAAANALVELVPTGPARAAVPPTGGRYVLEVGNGRVEFGDDFSEATLVRVVGMLRSC
jgi:transposase-like protein